LQEYDGAARLDWWCRVCGSASSSPGRNLYAQHAAPTIGPTTRIEATLTRLSDRLLLRVIRIVGKRIKDDGSLRVAVTGP
jgi:hypothetical protein